MVGMLTQKQAAKAMGVSVRTVQAWQYAGILPASHLPGRIVRIHPKHVAELIKRGYCGRGSTPEPCDVG